MQNYSAPARGFCFHFLIFASELTYYETSLATSLTLGRSLVETFTLFQNSSFWTGRPKKTMVHPSEISAHRGEAEAQTGKLGWGGHVLLQPKDCAATDYGNMGCKGGNPMNGPGAWQLVSGPAKCEQKCQRPLQPILGLRCNQKLQEL